MKHYILFVMAALLMSACTEDNVVIFDDHGSSVTKPDDQTDPGNLECTNGDLRCNGAILEKCKSRTWKTAENCANGCNSKTLKCNAASENPPQDVYECTPGTSLCGGGILKTCIDGHYETASCEQGCDDTGRACRLPSTCSDGTVICHDGTLKSCSQNAWETTDTCPNGCAADGKSCAQTCGDGQTVCHDGVLKTCQSGVWQSTDCPLGCTATGNDCAECNAAKCEGDQLTACSGGRWAATADTCPNGCNESGTDCALAETCAENDTVCTEDQVKQCSGNTWTKIKDCPDGCDAQQKDCFTKVCDDNALRCDGSQLQICTNNAWGKKEDCPAGCDDAKKACTPKVCDANALQCSGNTLQICANNAWTKKEDCAGGCDAAAKKCIEVNNNVPTRYITGPGKYDTPITPYVVQQMKNIMAKNGSRYNDVIMKVGDSHYDAAINNTSLTYGFMRCFSKNVSYKVTLDGRNYLQAAIDEFQKTKDSFIRDSEAAVGGQSTRYSFMGTPTHLTAEINAMNPRFAVFGHGSNDLGNGSFTYTKSNNGNGYAWAMQDFYRQVNKALDQMIAGGIIPIIQGVAPNLSTPTNINYMNGAPAIDKRDYPRFMVPAFDAVSRGIAEARQLPWFDTYNAFWGLPGHGVRNDHVHETQADSPCDFTASGLQYGANVRNLSLIETLSASWKTVVKGEAAPGAVIEPFKGSGSKNDPFIVTSLPFTHSADMTKSTNKAFDVYSCSTSKEPGAEYYYKMVLNEKKRLKMFVVSARDANGNEIDQDIHVLKGSIDANQCVARSDILLMGTLDAGTYYISIDTYDRAGLYLMGVIECLSDDERCNDPIKAF